MCALFPLCWCGGCVMGTVRLWLEDRPSFVDQGYWPAANNQIGQSYSALKSWRGRCDAATDGTPFGCKYVPALLTDSYGQLCLICGGQTFINALLYPLSAAKLTSIASGMIQPSAWCTQLSSIDFTGWLTIAVFSAVKKSSGAATLLTSLVRIQMANPVAASTLVTVD